ncbi:hypothetical protein FKM82_013425 [Ascaphus truei]
MIAVGRPNSEKSRYWNVIACRDVQNIHTHSQHFKPAKKYKNFKIPNRLFSAILEIQIPADTGICDFWAIFTDCISIKICQGKSTYCICICKIWHIY